MRKGGADQKGPIDSDQVPPARHRSAINCSLMAIGSGKTAQGEL